MSASNLRIYWLYYGNKVLTAVRMIDGASDIAIRAEAVEWHRRIPLCYPDYAPFEWERMLERAEVRRD